MPDTTPKEYRSGWALTSVLPRIFRHGVEGSGTVGPAVFGLE